MSVYCASWCDLTVTQAQEEETRRIARQKELETRRQAAIQRKAEEDRQRAEEEERKAREAREEIERRRKEREEAAAKREEAAAKRAKAAAEKKVCIYDQPIQCKSLTLTPSGFGRRVQ